MMPSPLKIFNRLITAVIILAAPSLLYPHPHVFIDPSVTVFIQNNQVTTLSLKWVFDEMTSGLCYEAFDNNKNKILDPAEEDNIRKNIFPGLAEYDYYTYITFDGVPLKKLNPGNLRAHFNKEKCMVYEFTITLNKTFSKSFSIYFTDKTIYSDFAYTAAEFKIAGKPAGRLTISERDDDYKKKIVFKKSN